MLLAGTNNKFRYSRSRIVYYSSMQRCGFFFDFSYILFSSGFTSYLVCILARTTIFSSMDTMYVMYVLCIVVD